MTFLIDLGIKATLAFGLAFLIALGLRRRSSSVRYALWTCALGAMLLMPSMLLLGPVWTMQTVPRVAEAQAEPSVSVVVHGGRPMEERQWPQELPVILWVTGILAMLSRIALGHWRVRSLFGGSEEIRDSRWLALSVEVAESIGFRRTVVLKRSTATDVPLSYGLFRATVLLPSESEQWTEDRCRIVLLHEMIHGSRFDSLWGLLAQLATAVYWFHPLAWAAAAQFRKEQERSCDDAVVTSGIARTEYAAKLVDVARSIAIPEPALGMAESFDLEGRIHALLDPLRKRSAASRKLCAVMFVAALAMMLPLASIHAQSNSSFVPEIAVGETEPSQNAETPQSTESPREAPAPAPKPVAPTPPPEQPAPISLAGSVYDPSGAVIPGATVTLKNIGSANEEMDVANAVGQYKFQGIPAGQYLLKVTSPGFAIYQKTLSLEAGMVAIDVSLSIGAVNELVQIDSKRPQSAAQSNASPQRIRVGGNVQPCNLISKVNPEYPGDAKAEGVEGTVLLRAVISKDGALLNVTSISNGVDRRLVNAALAAVSLWRYQPAQLNAEPVEVITTIAVAFRLN